MDVFLATPSLVLLAIVVVSAILCLSAQRQVRHAKRALSAEDNAVFTRNYHAARLRVDMPDRFVPLARAMDRLRLAYYVSLFVAVAGVFIVILLGPFRAPLP